MPRGRPPKSVDPNASSGARLGAEIRASRVARNLTLEALSDRIGYTPQHISGVELADIVPSEAFVAACERALKALGQFLPLYPPVLIEQASARQKRAEARVEAGREALRSAQEVEDVKRRAFLGLGLSVVLLGPEAAAQASDAQWERISQAWAYEVATAPDRRALLPGLVADLRRLHENAGPQRVTAQLSSYVAAIAVSTGEHQAARRWWTKAKAAARGDSHLYAYMTGREAVNGLYGIYSPAKVVMLADEALSATTAPCIGRMSALSAQAQAQAMLDRQQAASETLAALERTFERLPDDVTRDKLSALGWPQERLHHVRSFCGMYGVDGGEAARTEAMRLYADADWRSRAQIKLHRAASEADPGLALSALAPLKGSQRSDRFVRLIAKRALASCEAREVAGTADLREALTA